MALNKATFTINSRQYTVVAEESVEYIEKLCAHINEKVQEVIEGGHNIMGERPIVLAALNICDEYYKALEENTSLNAQLDALSERNQALKKTTSQLNEELRDAKSDQVSIDEAAMRAEVDEAKSELDDANNQIKFLEGHIQILQNKIDELEERYEKREQEILDMIEKG